MAGLEVRGVVTRLGEVQTFKNDFKKRCLYLESEDTKQREYNAPYCLEAAGKKWDILDNVKEGDDVLAQIQICSNENGGRTFTSLRVWKVEVMSKPTISANNRPLVDTPIIKDDLPF